MKKSLLLIILLTNLGCDKDKNFLTGYLKNTRDVIYTDCDPYKEQKEQTCAIFATNNGLRIYNSTDDEFVLGPTGYFPLKINTGSFNHLANVISINAQAKFFIAADELTKNLFVISSSDLKLSHKPIVLNDIPSSIAAFLDNSFINVVISYKEKNFIDILKINPQNNHIDETKQIILKDTVNKVIIDDKALQIVVSHESANYLSVLSVKNNYNIQQINLGFACDNISLGYQNNQLYALVFKTHAKKIALVNITNKNLIETKELDNMLTAGYLASDTSSQCQNNKQWFLLADNKANIHYFSFDTKINALSSLSLKDKEILNISNINIYKIISSHINNLTNDKLCKMQMIFASSLAFDKYNQPIELIPTSCEGDTKNIINLISAENLLKDK